LKNKFFDIFFNFIVNSNYFPYLCGLIVIIVHVSVLKCKFSILPVTIAAFLLVAFTAVPHHHHGAMMCLATEQHEDAHDEANHVCTPHHCDGEKAPNANSHCAAELEYIASAQQEIDDDHFCKLQHLPFHLLPTLFAWVNLSGNLAVTPGKKYKYRPVVAVIESAGAGQSHGLRAPPALLS
jgi:hypothetical protein